jgi:UDP-N-acetylmuramoyl-L-alanyl-D-glutamate--2,6-diaminopimelate ligase
LAGKAAPSGNEGLNMRCRLDELLPWVVCPAIEVGGLCDVSHAVRPGEVFIALSGTRCHGAEFVREAQTRGAVAIVYDPAETALPPALSLPAIAVPRLKERLGEIAARFYGFPTREMEVIGVTGTNGKTSCSVFLAQALGGGVMGTLGWGRLEALYPTFHTTAPALETQKRLATLKRLGIQRLAMEVSSHALAQGRVNGVEFSLALWTNLSRDHLDYHGSFEAYLKAKRKLFSWSSLKAAVLNLDDPAWPNFLEAVASEVRVVGFSTRELSSSPVPYVAASRVRYHPKGMEYTALWGKQRAEVKVPLLGEANLANVQAVLACLLARGEELEAAAKVLAALTPVPGRMECFRAPGRPLVVVDYAHTPAALELALRSLRRFCRGRLWVVFGCGGERDRGKRPLMGGIAERLADRVILTDDNPRGESPAAIIADIRAGMKSCPPVLHERREAIAAALTSASPEDIVLVAGKGHEDYQEIQGERLPFSDRALVAELLQEGKACD